MIELSILKHVRLTLMSANDRFLTNAYSQPFSIATRMNFQRDPSTSAPLMASEAKHGFVYALPVDVKVSLSCSQTNIDKD